MIKKDKPCFFGDCEKKKMIGNFVIYDDLNDNNINDNNINDNIVETFIKSEKFLDKRSVTFLKQVIKAQVII